MKVLAKFFQRFVRCLAGLCQAAYSSVVERGIVDAACEKTNLPRSSVQIRLSGAFFADHKVAAAVCAFAIGKLLGGA